MTAHVELRAGVHRSSVSDEQLGEALRESEWAYAHLDGWDAGSRTAVLRALGEALGFPEWYGANLDALWDCLRDLSDPVVLVWDGWSRCAGADQDGFAAIVRVLAERAAEAGDVAVLLRGDGPDLPATLGVTELS